jgi:hypothetical protein
MFGENLACRASALRLTVLPVGRRFGNDSVWRVLPPSSKDFQESDENNTTQNVAPKRNEDSKIKIADGVKGHAEL